ncbi:MAG: glycosyltransferase family 2 protein [Chryseolinea sp.]
MKVSIITVCYNSASTIRETIESILSQDYPNIEYIVVDGNSTDGTQGIVQSYGSRISRFISEKDKGLYDAMNKGIDMATGDIVGILNSDDLYVNNQVISNVVEAFVANDTGVVYGDLYYFRTGSPAKVRRVYKGREFSLRRAKFGLMPPHPTFFVKKEIYEKFGKFDIRYTLSADFDLILRFLGIHKVTFKYLPKMLVAMRLGGKSTSSIKRILIMNREDLDSCRRHGVNTNIVRFHMKYFVKLLSLR